MFGGLSPLRGPLATDAAKQENSGTRRGEPVKFSMVRTVPHEAALQNSIARGSADRWTGGFVTPAWTTSSSPRVLEMTVAIRTSLLGRPPWGGTGASHRGGSLRISGSAGATTAALPLEQQRNTCPHHTLGRQSSPKGVERPSHHPQSDLSRRRKQYQLGRARQADPLSRECPATTKAGPDNQ